MKKENPKKQLLFYSKFLLSIAGIACFFVLMSCGKTKEAREQLAQAQALYENKQYPAAKSVIDSLRIHYPREIEVLKEALSLMRKVERSECERNISYCDSMMPVRLREADDLKKGFLLEKDAVYEDIGNYIWKEQSIEKNVQRSYIRCGVDEKGEIYLASVYFGGKPINHTGLKISTPDGSFAETASIAYDGGMNYRFKDLGNTTEVVTYKGANCMDAVNFIYQIEDKIRIKIEYTGGNSFSLQLSEKDKKVIRATYDLAIVLADMEAMQREKDKSMKKIAYLDHKLENQPTNPN